jgi:hypothetical protein
MMQTEPMQSMASATASNAEVFDTICIDIDIDMKVLRNNNPPKTSNPDNTRSAMPMPGDRKTRTHTECYTEATNSTGASESWRRVLSRSNSGRSTGSSSTAFSSNSKSVSSTKSSCSKSPSKKGKKDAKSCLKASKDKPKRPLSAYNIFFKHTRTRIIQGLDDEGTTAEEVTIASIEAIVANSTKPRVRRSNRKTHGQIGFGDLARTIAQKWKAIDKDRRAIYERYAALDMKRYRRDISVWKARKETEALAEAIAESSCNGNTSNDDEGSKRAFSPTTSDDEFKTPQHRALNTTSANSSFSSIDSEGSLSIDDESRETKNSTFPTHSVPTEKTAIDNNNNNNNEMLRKSQELEVLIHELKREVSALKFNNDSNRKKIHNYNNANNSNYHQQHDSPGNFQQLMPPYPVGPSIERMQELHRRRMLRGDFLPPFGNHPRENPYAPSHGTTSNSMVHRKFFDDAPTVDTDLEGIDVDPIPFEEVFHPSGVGEFDIF